MDRNAKIWVLGVSCALFFSIGLFGASLGPVLPDLARVTGSDLATMGSVFTAIFFGSLLTQLAAGAISDRLGHGPVVLGGLVILSVGMLGVALSHSLPLTLASALVAGLGDGAVIISTNLLVAQVFASRSVTALNLSNVFFGLGAVAGPSLAGWLLRTWGSALPLLWVMCVLFLVPIPFVVLLRLPRPERHSSGNRDAVSVSVHRSPFLWLLGGLLLIYLGTEQGTGNWFAPYLNLSTSLPLDTAAYFASGFWLAFVCGRVIAAFLGRRLAANALLLICLGGALLASGVLVASTGNLPLSVAGSLFLGLSLGPIYPTMVAALAAAFPSGTGKAAGIVMTMASVGGITMPWLQGVLLIKAGPRSSMVLVAVSALGMLVLHLLSRFAVARPGIHEPRIEGVVEIS